MALSRRVALAAPWLVAGVGVLTALAMISVVPGSASADTAAGGCRATARTDSHWGNGPTSGAIVGVTVTNTAATPATTWSVTWTPADGQQVVNAWNATVSTSGRTVTAVNLAWNGRLAPGASTTFGMQLAGSSSAPALSCSNNAVSPPSSPPVSSSAPGPGDVRVTEADTRTAVTLVLGQTLGVSLPSSYLPLTSTSPALTLVSSSGGYPTGQPLTAQFRAVGTGSLDLSTVSDDPCFHTTPPCARPVLQWTVHVDVVPASPAGDVNLTEAANRTTVNLVVGQTLGVSLPANYRPFTSVNPALTLVWTTGGYPTGQPLRVLFRAVGGASFDLYTLTDAACNHDPTPCPSPDQPWTVRINTLYPPPSR
jgi:cellulose binding protein with CBM2 domain